MAYLELDDIIYSLQKFGGVTTYWQELSARIGEFVPGEVIHSRGSQIGRVYSPPSHAKIFHSSHFRISSSSSVKNVTTIHDLIYEKGLSGGRGRLLNLYERKKAVEHADAIICISDSTRRDLYEYYGKLVENKPVHVIYHGCTQLPKRVAGQPAVFQKPEFVHLDLAQGQFFMFVGGRGGYKNFDLVLNAFVAGNFAARRLKLLCTGATFNEAERDALSRMKLTESVVSIGFMDTVSLGELYSKARALVYPSAYEGFGLPPLEAMASGCPVICSQSSSLPEVVGESGILIESGSIPQLVNGMKTVLEEDCRVQMIAAGFQRAAFFDWQKTAKEHAEVYRSLAAY